MNNYTLHQLQDWMKTVLISRGDLPQKLHTAAQPYGLEIENVVESKRGVSAHQRLDIYAAGYVLRLIECLKSDFPGLMTFLGKEVFEIFAKAYIVTLPSTSWSLFHLSKRFPQFLKETQPPARPGIDPMLLELPGEIAAFERAKAETVWAKGNENKVVDALTTRHLPLGFLQYNQIIQAPPCLRLLRQPYPVYEFLVQLAKDKNTPPPKAQTTYTAITRQHYQLRVIPVKRWQYEFLKAIRQPVSIHEAASEVATRCQLEPGHVLSQLFVWLPVAQESGLAEVALLE